ncbi:MAG: hypothetical protein RL685_873 [Pseudomonadota bacterium]|jgi:hypothetical protein
MSSLHLGCWGLLGILVGAQLFATLTNRNRWPIPAQNMFSHLVPAVAKRLMVVLHDSKGGESVHFPYRILPVEFFRAQRLLHRVYIDSEDITRQANFAGALLQRLNHRPWNGFDEIDASVRPAVGTQFVGCDLVLMEFTLTERAGRDPLACLGTPLGTLFSMRIEPTRSGA